MSDPSLDQEVALRTASADRRGAERLESGQQATCQPAHDADHPGWQAPIRDVSAHGIGLLLPEELKPGTIVNIHVDPGDGMADPGLLARVVHTTSQPEGDWLVGCAFILELDNATLRSYQAARIRPDPNDCRAWVRFPSNVKTVCFSCYSTP